MANFGSLLGQMVGYTNSQGTVSCLLDRNGSRHQLIIILPTVLSKVMTMKVFAVRLDGFVQLAHGGSVNTGYADNQKWVGSQLKHDCLYSRDLFTSIDDEEHKVPTSTACCLVFRVRALSLFKLISNSFFFNHLFQAPRRRRSHSQQIQAVTPATKLQV